jgi:polysaccharide chain length determinant protein (PEP-CTERM system associated)
MDENSIKKQMDVTLDQGSDTNSESGISLQYLMAALRRHFWYVVVTFFVIFMATLIYCMQAPKVYRSSTVILVQPQEVPYDYVRPTITSDAIARLNTLKEQVMSRPRLEKIIIEYNLYQKVRSAKTMYDAVERMRRHVEIKINEPGGSRRRQDVAPASFEVSFVGADPVKVRDVTATIANLFIEDNLRLRESQAVSTSKFLERELEGMREELRQKEERVRQFKEEYIGMLPEQMENNYRILAQLQQHLDSLNVIFQQTENRRVLLQAQLGRLKTLQAQALEARASLSSAANGQRPFSLEELRQELEALESRYRDQHPDVIILKKTIARLEEKKRGTDPEADVSGLNNASSIRSKAQRLLIVQKEDLIIQLKLIDKEIDKYTDEKEQTSSQIKTYRNRIESGPRVEAMFVDLRRGYEDAQKNYQSLLQKKMQAKLAENLERTQKGEQFIVLDPANLSLKPFKPNILKVLIRGFMAALVSGFGLVFVKEFLDPTFHSGKDLEYDLHLPVIVSIPIIMTPKSRRLGLYKKMGTVTALVFLSLILLYALLVLLRKNPTLLPFPYPF